MKRPCINSCTIKTVYIAICPVVCYCFISGISLSQISSKMFSCSVHLSCRDTLCFGLHQYPYSIKWKKISQSETERLLFFENFPGFQQLHETQKPSENLPNSQQIARIIDRNSHIIPWISKSDFPRREILDVTAGSKRFEHDIVER